MLDLLLGSAVVVLAGAMYYTTKSRRQYAEVVRRQASILDQQTTDMNTLATRLDSAYEELEASNARLKKMVFEDDITGLYNRRFLLLRLEEEVSRWRRHSHALSLALFDVDAFLGLAQAESYAAHEEVLATVAGILAECSRGTDVLARYDGSRFAALLVETRRPDANRFAESIRELAATRLRSGGSGVRWGIASLPEDAAAAEDLMSAADAALRRRDEEFGGQSPTL